eukprot:scaffold78451_cov61-Cyclotella_meneghiniana.AAC.1
MYEAVAACYINPDADDRRKNYFHWQNNGGNATTAKSVGNGIANSVTDKQTEQLEEQAFVLAEFANSINEQSSKQFKEMIELFKKTLEAKDSLKSGNPNGGGGGKQKKKCPHCGSEVYHKPLSWILPIYQLPITGSWVMIIQ